MSSPDLAAALQDVVDGEVFHDALRQALYASDASNYRVLPRVVVHPRHADDIAAAAEVARRHRVPLTTRGAGTSVAGNAVGEGIVLDTSVHLDRISELDPDSATVRVEPGVVLIKLQREAARHGLRFGPDPSTLSRATVGGMIGNNACGPHAVAFGKTSENVVSLDVIDGRGRRFTAADDMTVVPGLAELVNGNLAVLRTELGQFGRQVSGYSLEHLLPEKGANLARTLVGTEGTVATVTSAVLNLVPLSPAPVLVALGYPTMAAAADDVPLLLPHRPLAMEGLDAGLVAVVRRSSTKTYPDLPAGGGWLFVEVGGQTPGEAAAKARALVRSASTAAVRILPAGAEATALWSLRADGAGLAGRTAEGRQAWPGWEDAAVPPAALGDYLRDFDVLMTAQGVTGQAYGHFGDGCVHVRVDLPLDRDPGSLRSFVEEAADLVTRYGGSYSGEHGDGRARSELLDRMYSPAALDVFRGFKHLLDPANLLNPGLIVDPVPLDSNLRRPQALPLLADGGFAFADDSGDFTKAVHRCVGVGKCRADTSSAGGFMCPSYLATGSETDVTRGRARVLQEIAIGASATDWASEEVHEALDLCLSCKACASDCPAGVDMARYKAEVLNRTYRGRLRPQTHYLLGWLPRWLRLVRCLPRPGIRLGNSLMAVPALRDLAFKAGRIDRRRQIPRFATTPWRPSRQARASRRIDGAESTRTADRRVVLWVDSFTAAFSPGAAAAAATLLEDAGYVVATPGGSPCCGLTWITTGQLDAAKRRLGRLLDVFTPLVEEGHRIVGLEPSCTAVLRDDLVDLLPLDPRSRVVADATRTLAELLSERCEGQAPWSPPDLTGIDVVVQPHCHQHAVMGFDPDQRLLTAAGAQMTVLAGCCGLAGNFGMEKGHYDTSVAVAERGLLPALEEQRRRRADGEGSSAAVFVADGFSCRTQAAQLGGVEGRTLAEVFAERLEPGPSHELDTGVGTLSGPTERTSTKSQRPPCGDYR